MPEHDPPGENTVGHDQELVPFIHWEIMAERNAQLMELWDTRTVLINKSAFNAADTLWSILYMLERGKLDTAKEAIKRTLAILDKQAKEE